MFFNILEIIQKKQNKEELSKEEIEFFINGYTNDLIPDYQISALVMAIFINGMSERETTDLTIAMANSGKVLDLSTLGEIFVDKHSTGGVGDKVSLILLPIVASLGVPVAKMSGRGLGFTGGTVDKLQSIPGYITDITRDDFLSNVKKLGISIISQTHDLAPADKKLYALRDSISCVESIPLIASSIMSKKIASGAQKIVIDVTVGNGAFMKNMDEARKLAKMMIEIGKLANRETVCILTNMDEPLGYAVGNNLEVKEAISFLNGNMPDDLADVVFSLGAYMLKLSGKGQDIEENKNLMREAVLSGKAYKKFEELVKNQGGDISYIQNPEKFEKAKFVKRVESTYEGYVEEIPAEEFGKLASFLGAGRMKKEDDIDFSVGIVLNKKVGEYVKKGDTLFTVFANDEEKAGFVENKGLEIIKIGDVKKDVKYVYEVIE